jgi:IS30 family transposase
MLTEERMAASAKGYENGLGAMSAEERMAASAKGYENGLGAMSAEERMAASAKGYENGLGAMSAEERMVASMAASAGSIATKAAKRDAKWTAEIDATIERMIDDGVSYAEIASKLGNGLSKSNIYHRWNGHLNKLSSIIKPLVKPGQKSSITWTEDDDASIVRMRADDISYAKIASKLGKGLKRNDIKNRWNRHLK